jgi:hypothetical protein
VAVVYNIPEVECTLDAVEHILSVVVHSKDLISRNLLMLLSLLIL